MPGPMGGGHGPGGPGGHGPAQKAMDFKGTLKKLLGYIGRYKIAIFVVFIFAIASAAFSIIGPKVLGQATTEVFNGIMGSISSNGTGIDFGKIANIMFWLIALYLASALFSYIQGWVMTGISMKVTYRFRKDISHKINRMPLKYFESTSQGEVLSRVTNDVDMINQTMNQSMTQIITSITMIIGILGMMLSISVSMTLVALCIIPVALVIMLFIIKHSQKYFAQQQAYLGHVNGQVEETYSGHVVMKAFNAEQQCAETFDEYNNTLYASAWKSQFLSGLIHPAINFVSNLGYVAVCILGGTLAVKGTISVGDIQAFIQYVRSFTQPISQVANITNILQSTIAAAERVFAFLEEEEEVTESKNPVHVRIENSEVKLHWYDENGSKIERDFVGSVEFKNVHFGYRSDKIIINDFSAKIEPGQQIAIVGPTGAGKTTMVKLLMRFYDVNSGQILIDGHDIREFTRHGLRSLFGMVLQDTWLYNDTIRENIRYGRLGANDEEVVAASKAAHVHHFVKTLPEGYDVVMNEESSNVSQGQKQLMTIARAILADPKILILDEATSSVDTKTEVDIQRAMHKLMSGRTSFVIAHRLSTIRDADLILVMKDGDIVEQGTHDALLEKGGFYAELYNAQFENAAQSAD